MKRTRNDKLEAPANFADLTNQWSLESIACIILDRRLGLLRESTNDPNAVTLIKVWYTTVIIRIYSQVYYHSTVDKRIFHVDVRF